MTTNYTMNQILVKIHLFIAIFYHFFQHFEKRWPEIFLLKIRSHETETAFSIVLCCCLLTTSWPTFRLLLSFFRLRKRIFLILFQPQGNKRLQEKIFMACRDDVMIVNYSLMQPWETLLWLSSVQLCQAQIIFMKCRHSCGLGFIIGDRWGVFWIKNIDLTICRNTFFFPTSAHVSLCACVCTKVLRCVWICP